MSDEPKRAVFHRDQLEPALAHAFRCEGCGLIMRPDTAISRCPKCPVCQPDYHGPWMWPLNEGDDDE